MYIQNNDITQRLLRTTYGILSLTNSTLWTVDTILWCTKNPLPSWCFSFPCHRKKKSTISCSYSASFVPPNPPTPTKYICTSLIPWLLTSVNLTYTGSSRSLYQTSRPFLSLRLYQRISPGPRYMYAFRNKARFYDGELLAPRLKPRLEEHLLSAVRFNIFAATLHIGGRFSIRNMSTRHAVVTRTHLSWINRFDTTKIIMFLLS